MIYAWRCANIQFCRLVKYKLCSCYVLDKVLCNDLTLARKNIIDTVCTHKVFLIIIITKVRRTKTKVENKITGNFPQNLSLLTANKLKVIYNFWMETSGVD